MLTLIGGVSGGFGCGAADATQTFGGPGNRTDASSNEDVDIPVADTGPGPSDVGDDVFIPGKCGSGAKAGEGSVCVKVRKGAGATAPHINDESRKLGIDGVGALYVALLETDVLDTSTKAVAYRTFPSASSATRFSIETDLPRIAEISVKPGTYYALAVFYDQEPISGRDFAPGDYVPRLNDKWDLAKVEVTAGSDVVVDLDVYPVRAVDVDVRLKPGVSPSGSGAGPLRASLVTSGVPPAIVGNGHLPCASISADKASVVRIVTTSSVGSYWVKLALFDFAAGPEDPIVGALDVPPPEGALVNFGADAYASIRLTDGWISPKQTLELDRVVPFVGIAPSDPTPSCVAYTATPK